MLEDQSTTADAPSHSWPFFHGTTVAATVDSIFIERHFRCGYPWTSDRLNWTLRGRLDNLRGANLWRDEFNLEGRKRVKYGGRELPGCGFWAVRLKGGGLIDLTFTELPAEYELDRRAEALLRKSAATTGHFSDRKVSEIVQLLQHSGVPQLLEADRRMAREPAFRSNEGKAIRDYIVDLIAYRGSSDAAADAAWAAARNVLERVARVARGGEARG